MHYFSSENVLLNFLTPYIDQCLHPAEEDTDCGVYLVSASKNEFAVLAAAIQLE